MTSTSPQKFCVVTPQAFPLTAEENAQVATDDRDYAAFLAAEPKWHGMDVEDEWNGLTRAAAAGDDAALATVQKHGSWRDLAIVRDVENQHRIACFNRDCGGLQKKWHALAVRGKARFEQLRDDYVKLTVKARAVLGFPPSACDDFVAKCNRQIDQFEKLLTKEIPHFEFLREQIDLTEIQGASA